MKKNIGQADKIVRIIAALVLFSLFFLLEGDNKYWGLLGIIPLVTALAGFCPLYTPLKIDTGKSEK